VFANKVSIDVVNLAAMKLVFTEMRTQKRFVIIAGNETDLLTVELVGDFQTYRMRDFPDFGLSHRPEGRERATQLRLTQAKEEVRLVFSRIDAFAQNSVLVVMFDDRVMSGRDVIATERVRFAPKISELEFFVAHYARIRRPSGLILAREIIDHGALELVRLIDNVMRNT